MRTLVALASIASSALGAAFAAGVLVGDRPRHSHPSVLDEAARVIRAKADSPPSDATLDEAAIRGILGGLGDRWAGYYAVSPDGGPDTLQALVDGRYSGLGVWLGGTSANGVLIVSVTSGSPAAGAGVRAGERIVTIDGRDLRQADVASVAAALRGPSGSVAALTLTDTDGRVRTADVRRADVPAVPVSTNILAPGVERVRIAVFSRGVGTAVAAAVQRARAAGVRAIVLDLRGNPGGLLAEAVSTSSVFLDGGPVVSLSGRTVPEHTVQAARGGDTVTPLAVLVDGGTASAAEILAGALSDRDRAVLVGSRTFGKGSVQQLTHLSDGSALELTVAQYRTPSGQAVDGTGLTPDVRVDAGADPAVATERAVAVLQALLRSRS